MRIVVIIGTLAIVGAAAMPALAQAPAASPAKTKKRSEGDPARAAAIAQIKERNAQAQAAFDSYSFKRGRRKLDESLDIAAAARLTAGPELAETYILLGVGAIAAGNDLYRGLHAFTRAMRIDPGATVPKRLMTPQLQQVLGDAKKAVKAIGAPPTLVLATQKAKAEVAQDSAVDKDARGLVHVPVDDARYGLPLPLKVRIGSDIRATKVYLFYRPAGTVKFFKVQMKNKRGAFRGAVPARATKGRYVHYYIEARDQRDRLAAANGSAKSPNVVTIK